MTKGQWIVMLLASIGLLVILNIAAFPFQRMIGGGSCQNISTQEYSSPSGTNALFHTIEQCPGKEPESHLMIEAGKRKGTFHIFYTTTAKFVDSKGVIYSPISYGIKWKNDSEALIVYPRGLNIYSNVVSSLPMNRTEIREHQYEGISIKFSPNI